MCPPPPVNTDWTGQWTWKVSCTAAECLLPNPAQEGMQTAAGDGLVWPWSAVGSVIIIVLLLC